MMNNLKHILAVLAAVMLLALPLESRGQVFDDEIYTMLLLDQLEYAPGASGRPVSLELTGWTGGDINRLWVRAEGEQSTLAGKGEAEVEALYGRLLTPFFDVLAGARLDMGWGDTGQARGLLAVGLQGLAPYWIEVEPTFYVSQNGHVSARLAAEFALLITQRLIVEQEYEVGAALQDVAEWGVGSGVNDLGVGVRIRYEIWRKFAPYVGYSWYRRFGETADFARADGEPVSGGAFVFGVRFWR